MATAPQRAASSIWVFLADSLMKRVDPKQKDQDHLAQIEPEFSRLVAMPAELLARASSSGLDPTTLGQTQSAAHSLCALVRSFGGKSHAARVLLCKCVSPVLPACVSLVRQIAQRPSEHTGKAAQNAINLLVACFDVISKEMPEEFISGTVKDFIAMYSDPAAVKALSVDTGSSLLELLTLLARRPGQKFKQLSVQTVEWCLSVWPGLAPGGGITHADLLQLLCRVLRHQWRACAPQHVQGVLALMVQCFHALDPSAVQRFLLDEIVKLDEQTKVREISPSSILAGIPFLTLPPISPHLLDSSVLLQPGPRSGPGQGPLHPRVLPFDDGGGQAGLAGGPAVGAVPHSEGGPGHGGAAEDRRPGAPAELPVKESPGLRRV